MTTRYGSCEWAVYDVLYDASGPIFLQDIEDRVEGFDGADIEMALERLADDGALYYYKGAWELSPEGREWGGSGR